MTPRDRITYAIRIALSHALYYTGILGLVLRYRLRKRAVVLAYHRILTPEQRAATASQEGLIVDHRNFARQVALLKGHFTVLTLEDFERHLTQRVPFGGPCCLITFDDGWIDNYENASPLLKALDLPAVMFLPVNFIGRSRLFIRERLTHLLVRAAIASRSVPNLREDLRSHLSPFGLESVVDMKAVDPLPDILRLVGAHRYASGPAFEALVDTLAGRLGTQGADVPGLDTFIDWDQVEQLRQRGFAFGGHGAEHYVLTEVSATVARGEIESSKRVLEERLARPVRAFAYPNGRWSADIADTVKAAGYRVAFTIDGGHVSCEDDPFTLRRINIHDSMTRNTPMFMARIAGIF